MGDIPSNPKSWNQDKLRLAKHRSLPELYLRTTFCPVCGWGHCKYDDDDGSTAEHESTPRMSLFGPHDGPKIQGERVNCQCKRRRNCGHPNGVPYLESTRDCTNSEHSPQERFQAAIAVATATLTPALQLGPLEHPRLQQRHNQKEALDSQPQFISVCRDPLFDSTTRSRTSSRPSSLDLSDSRSSPMTVVKPSRSLKASRRNLAVGLSHNDTKKSSLNIDSDNDDHVIFKEIITDISYDEPRGTSSKRFSPLPPKLRTIRRRKRLSLRRTSSNSEESSVKPIAISLTFSSSAVPQILSPKVSMSALCDRATYSDGESRATYDSPSSPIPDEMPPQVHGSSERRASASLSTRPSTPLSASASFHPSVPANVRLGHPSRPYYSAIRKQGISPSSSRRSSIKTPAVSPTRPTSYSPPSPLPASKSAPPRHLSLSAAPHTSSFVSAFSLNDDSDDNVDEELPVIPLTPVPASGRMSFGTSLASVAKSLTRKRSTSGPSTVSTRTATHSRHSHSASSPQAVLPLSAAHLPLPPHHHGNMKGIFRMSSPAAGSGASGVGFSVSGEAELKMALAFSEAHNTDPDIGVSFVSATTPAIQEEEDVACVPTELPPALLHTSLSVYPFSPPSNMRLPTISNSHNSIAGRVKKLTQGLKDMLFMTTHGAGTTNTNSTTTTTTTT